MSLHFHDASVAVCRRYLERLHGLVDAAERHAQSHGLDAAALLDARLAPDMQPFATQVVMATGFTLRTCCPLAGVSVPDVQAFDATFDGLRARIANADTLLQSLDPARFDDAATRVPQSRAGDAQLALPAPEFLTQYALPNFFFHVAMAYAVLRHHGVPIGKADFDGIHAYPRPA